jgi:hypothetical protein
MAGDLAPRLVVAKGTCTVLYAYDVGAAIDLAAARQRVTDATEAARIEHRRHAPTFFQFDPPPLRVLQRLEPIAVAGRKTSGTVDLVLYDFGAVSVSYDIPISGPLDGLVDLAVALGEASTLAADSRARLEALLQHVGPAVRDANIAPLVEDYVLWRVEEAEGGAPVEEILRDLGGDVARLLSASRTVPSAEEVNDLVLHRLSFEPDDVTLVDWNAAFVLGRSMEDVCAVLEFANVQLLEARFLDLRLDRSLDRAYEALRFRARGPFSWLRRVGPDLGRVGEMQVDGAILFERLHNALKLLGDQFLARVHREAAQRFHLPEWNQAILRKLETIESIYQKLSDRAVSRRMEALEWLIIALIAASTLLAVFGVGTH